MTTRSHVLSTSHGWLALLATVLATTAAPSIAVGENGFEKVVIKGTARFDFDGATLHRDDADALMAKVADLKDVSWQKVVASGHTDSVGRSAYNKRLSEKRARAVKAYLVGQGLAADMVRTEGRASADPVAPNDTEQGRALNRRADVEFQGVRAAAR